ncbi:MAG: MmgE/PrpD family protein [Mesorhizobium sp.]|uniref:MmgE/PrpD family protein n=1 Tax=Mesorhizobium sp. TaxID=1871066 RepID=UPI001225CA44|nr:MmgE/PrpD family protein [Mesorhizobium sp.]TIM99879.1 MAG: MmgE/PrpD family protein [Mesorhizobium sp.]
MSIAATTVANRINPSSPFEHILFPRDPIHLPAGQLARFLTDLRYEDIPDDVLHKAKLITLDTIGCIIAGANTPLGEKILAAYHSGNNPSGCCVPGTSCQATPSLAAKVNAWLADVLDYEDVAVGHPSATVIPAALAMAEHLNASPQQFLAGVVAGYEAGIRVHDATLASPDVYRRFAVYHAWHGIAAGAAAMVVSGGTEEQFRSALGHAAANTSVPLWYVQYGRPAHALKANYGQMALGGIDAAICARRDIIGPFAMVSDAERGFARIIGSDRFDPTQLSNGLNQVWRIRESSLKAFPCCGFLHTTIDAISTLVNANQIDHNNVDQVQIRSFARISEWFSDSAPATDIDAQLSVEYVSAMALLSKEPGREWYSPCLMTSPAVTGLMTKIEIEIDPVAEQAFWNDRQYLSSVTILMKDGESYSATATFPPGHRRRPLSETDVEKKFLRNVRGTPLEKDGPAIVEGAMNMERLSSLNEMRGFLSTAEPGCDSEGLST